MLCSGLELKITQPTFRSTFISEEKIEMTSRFLLTCAIALFLAGLATAQDESKAQVTLDYSYFRWNPGLPSVFNSKNLNGGGGQAVLYLNSWFGIGADLQGYASSTECVSSINPFGFTGCASASLFTYQFGPQVKRRVGRFQPFGEVLPGGAHSNFYGSACRNITGICAFRSPSNNAFALAVGVGIDVQLTSKVAIRLFDADYQLTRFGNNFTGGNNSQSNFRFQSGIQFHF
jgi:opacity protein-like surface antigen